jgi:hypothetical protein
VNLNDVQNLSPEDRADFLDTTEYSLGSAQFNALVLEATGGSEPITYFYDQAPANVGKTRIKQEFELLLKQGKIPSGSCLTWAKNVDSPGLQAAYIL